MRKLLIIAAFLYGCGESDRRPDTLGDDEYSRAPLNIGASTEVPVDAGSDAARDIKACHKTFDEVCLPVCLKMVSKSPQRKSCIERCEFEYRVCTGCYGNMPNE